MRTGRGGYSSAHASGGSAGNAAAPAARCRNRRRFTALLRENERALSKVEGKRLAAAQRGYMNFACTWRDAMSPGGAERRVEVTSRMPRFRWESGAGLSDGVRSAEAWKGDQNDG